MLVVPEKEIKTQQLDYFSTNKRFSDYYQLADSLIEVYIVSIDAKVLKRTDAFSFNMMNYMLKKNENSEEVEINMRDSLMLKNTEALKLSNRLIEISEKVVHNMDDETKLNKTLEWLNLSDSFIALPEAQIIRAAVYRKLGQNEQSQSALELAKSSIYFDETCEEKITAFGL